jgi:NADPH-dependent ferric siderophore reductase
LLGDFARNIRIPDGIHAYVWASGEATSLKPVRSWARSHGFGKDDSDITGYWRRNATQDDLQKPTVRDRLEHAVAHVLRREH